MTNLELMALYYDIPTLIAGRDEAQEAVTKALSDLREFNDKIEQAYRVTDVVDGVCLRIDVRDDGRWCDARTLVESEQAGILTIHLYEMANNKPYWAVRINEIGTKNRCVHNYERWFGGKVIGLGGTMSYEEAEAVARQWLLGDGKLV
jgi:hypothetical protein